MRKRDDVKWRRSKIRIGTHKKVERNKSGGNRKRGIVDTGTITSSAYDG